MMTGQGFLAIWSDVPPEHETDYLHWMTREHAQERLAIPGFREVRLFRNTNAGLRRFFILYTLDSAEVMAIPAYLARLNDPSPWSRRIMPLLMNFRRGGGWVATHVGGGHGSLVAPIFVDDGLCPTPSHLTEIANRDRIVAVSLLHADAAATSIQTDEKRLRSHDHGFDKLMVVEALDAGALDGLLTEGAHVFEQIFAQDATSSNLGSLD
ncbi:MAG: hypothetical protein ACT6XY_02625 [Phreatobacter sp.]|uniref:hypothetical protein n=1 Tax=Phreatobacter sp. TaxID=1966341 RepID=UPI004036DB67